MVSASSWVDAVPGINQMATKDGYPRSTRQQKWQRQQKRQQVLFAQPPSAQKGEQPIAGPTEACPVLQQQRWADVPIEPERSLRDASLNASAKRRMRRKHQTRRTQEVWPKPGRRSIGGQQLRHAKLMEDLEAGGEARIAALAQLQGSVALLALDREGCRTVQFALQVADPATATRLLEELHGQVPAALHSPHGNYVLQAVIRTLPTAMSGFVVQELMGAGADAARHRFGCRVLSRLIENSGPSAGLSGLLEEILAEAGELCRHTFAHFVIQSVLEHMPLHRPRIIEVLRTDLVGNACNRNASHILEAVFTYCDEADQQSLALEMGSSHEGVIQMAQDQYGWFVLKTVLKLPGAGSEDAWGHLRTALPYVEGTKYGRRLLRELGVATPV